MDDLAFVQRCVQGGKQDWDRFIEKYSRLIYNYIRSILSSHGSLFSQGHIDDCFQEFICFLIQDDFKKLRSYQGKNGCSLASWLRQVVIHFTVDYLRKLKPTVSLDAETDEGTRFQDIIASDIDNAPDGLIQQEQLATLQECVERLGNEDKLFLELHFHRGVRLEELKTVLKRSRGAVDMLKARILARLRECFEGKGFTLDFAL